ncbi:MAG: isoprenylcysteine carboxylmethyltransferase family protein [Rhizobiaceae bacterium]
MSDSSERPVALPWPPIVYLAAAVIAIGLGIVYPLPWLLSPLAELAFAAGIAVIVGAVAMEVSAVMALRRARTTVLPTRRPDHLVTGGPYSFTRNPIYLGNTMLLVGAGLIFGLLWFLPMAIAAAMLVNKLVVEREETVLEHRFGRAYRDYRKKARRWI